MSLDKLFCSVDDFCLTTEKPLFNSELRLLVNRKAYCQACAMTLG